jgi:transcriptional regulator with PAS, ATPase and Fis domain
MRNDFFYRLQVIQIRLPPLRQRKQDIPLLVDHFVQQMSPPSALAKIPGHIMDLLLEYEWPGNVRELRNVLQRYLTIGRLEFLSADPLVDQPPMAMQFNLRLAVQRLENSLITQALQQANGNRTKAADLLGISRRALSRKNMLP